MISLEDIMEQKLQNIMRIVNLCAFLLMLILTVMALMMKCVYLIMFMGTRKRLSDLAV